MKRISLLVMISLLLLQFVNCDSKKDPLNGAGSFRFNMLCYTYALCGNTPGVKFGILGDSWTDLALGIPAIKTIRTYMEVDYGYKMYGATLGGRFLSEVVDQGLYLKVIEDGGKDLKYMILSLGGNDFQLNSEKFIGDIDAERSRRLTAIQFNLKRLVQAGNAYKMNRYGGEPLLWIIHGYDYPSPDVDTFYAGDQCRNTLIDKGFTTAQVDLLLPKNLDLLNEMYLATTRQEPSLRYIDLRKTLGGPPFSLASNMFDCIHPNTGGFKLISAKFVESVRALTNDER